MLVGCSQVAPAPVEEECDAPEPAELHLPGDCWEDFERCPAEEETPWAECSRRYVCENPEGEPWCARAVDCQCIRAFNATCDEQVEEPGFCAYQP